MIDILAVIIWIGLCVATVVTGDTSVFAQAIAQAMCAVFAIMRLWRS